jgi:hypothetical protein
MKVAFPLTLVFAACIGLIHVQPYDDSELRAFLTPDDCPMPCIMGIRPGVTTADEAIAILNTHEWVEHFEGYPDTQIIDVMQWTDHRPYFINTAYPSRLRLSTDSKIIEIEVPTTIESGEIHLLFGEPPSADYGSLRENVFVLNMYRDESLYMVASLPCPLGYKSFLQSPVRITFSSVIFEYTGLWYWNRGFRELQKTYC